MCPAHGEVTPIGSVQIKAEQKCRGYHASLTKIDSEAAPKQGSDRSVQRLSEDSGTGMDGLREEWREGERSKDMHCQQ